MKNSLQLELQLKIKRANRFFTAKLYSDAIREYSEGLQLYQENRRYNETVSEQFQSLLYSLRGNSYSLSLNSEQAEQDFAKSLNINPYNSVTLSRRAKHFMKEKRFTQAVQDIDMALLYDPQNLSYLSLLNSIQNYVNQISDQQQKKHVTVSISDVKARLQAKPPTQSESQGQDNDQMLNFSNLKKIDRKSVKLSPFMEKRKSAIEFKQDEILEYESKQNDQLYGQKGEEQKINIRISSSSEIDQKLKKQDEELKQLQAQEQEIRKTQVNLLETIVLTKSHDKSRKSILRRTSINNSNKGDQMIFISTPGQKSSFSRRSSISAASIKDIDGKIVMHQTQNIKFRPSLSHLSKSELIKIDQIPKEDDKKNLTRTTPKLNKRKSCLRSSNKFLAQEVDQLSKTAPNIRKSSNFLNIKSIDGEYHNKSKSSEQQENVNIKIETDSDDDDEHDIFGSKKQKQVMKIGGNFALIQENMEQMPEVTIKRLSKKKSILKKDSFLDGSMLSWKNQKKKSVLFKTG